MRLAALGRSLGDELASWPAPGTGRNPRPSECRLCRSAAQARTRTKAVVPSQAMLWHDRAIASIGATVAVGGDRLSEALVAAGAISGVRRECWAAGRPLLEPGAGAPASKRWRDPRLSEGGRVVVTALLARRAA